MTMKPDTREWFTLPQLAQHWCTSTDTLAREIKAGTLEAIRVGKRFRVHADTVRQREAAVVHAQYLKSRRVERNRSKWKHSGVDYFAGKQY